MLRGLEGGSTYEVVVVRVEGESLKETVVGRTKVETAKVLIREKKRRKRWRTVWCDAWKSSFLF